MKLINQRKKSVNTKIWKNKTNKQKLGWVFKEYGLTPLPTKIFLKNIQNNKA